MFPLQEIYETINKKKEIYIKIAQKTHQVDSEMATSIIDGELESYLTRLQKYWENPNAHKSGQPTLTSAQGVNIFLEVMQVGLSFSQSAGHVYVSRLKGTGSAVRYQVTADGLIYQAQKAGAIDHLSEPVLVQKGEPFSIKNTPEGRHVAIHEIIFEGRPPFNFNNFLVGYVYIIYPNGDRELSWISGSRMETYRNKSVNKYLYDDESFIQTKVIKQALRKVRKSPFMQQRVADDEEIITNHMEWEPQINPFDNNGQNTQNIPNSEPF